MGDEQLADRIFRRFPVIGAIALVIVVVGCVATVAPNITNVLGLLPALLTLLLIVAAISLFRRVVARSSKRTESEPTNAGGPRSADDIWDTYGQRQTSLHAEPSGPALESAPVHGAVAQVSSAWRPSARQRLTRYIVPGVIGGLVAMLGISVLYLNINYGIDYGPGASHASLNDVGTVLGLCFLPMSLLAGGWLGSFGGSNGRAVAAALGFKANRLDVITAICAGLTAAAGVFILDLCFFILSLA